MEWVKNHKVLSIIIGIVLLAVVAGAAGTSTDETSTANNSSSSQSTEQAEEKDTLAKVGTPVRDGKFEFTISSMNCSKTTVGNEFLRETAQGKFCILDLKVENIGDEAQIFFSSEQKIFNSEGQQFSNDTEAELMIDGNSDVWLESINPGNFVQGKVVFDVPTDTTLIKAELHDSAFSSGVEVSLTD